MLGWGPFYPSEIAELGEPAVDYDMIGALLEQADARGMQVWLGLGRGSGYLEFSPTPDLEACAEAVALGERVAAELHDRYGRLASLYGWYLSHETNDLANGAAYYDPMARALEAFGPQRPVMVAPAGTPIATAAVIAASEVDVFAYQDAVGAGYIPYEYTWDPEQRIAMLEEIYAGYAAIHAGSGKHLWADTELWQMDGPHYASPYPAALERVLRQVEIEARHTQQLTAYAYTGYLSDPSSDLQLGGPEAEALYRGYRGYWEGLGL